MPVVSRLYHFSLAGIAYAATTCVLLIGAINGQNNLLFALFGLAVGGLVISGILSGWSLMGLRIEREVLDPGHAGGTLRIRYRVTNHNRLFGAFGLVVEEIPEARTWLAKKLSATTEGRIQSSRVFVPHVPTRATRVMDADIPALARGKVTLGPLRITSTFPFGLTRKSVTFHEPRTTWIRPASVELRDISLPAAPSAQPRTSRTNHTHHGADFFALRPFQPGDSLRAIAWRASARADEPISRVYSDRPGFTATVQLDITREPPANPDHVQARERAIAAAAALATTLTLRGVDVALATTTHGVLVPHARGAAHVQRILDALAKLDDTPRTEQPPRTSPSPWTFVVHPTAPAATTTSTTLHCDASDPRTYASTTLPKVDFREHPPEARP